MLSVFFRGIPKIWIFTDVHGDIKVKFKSKIKDKLFHELTCIEDLEVLLGISEDEI